MAIDSRIGAIKAILLMNNHITPYVQSLLFFLLDQSENFSHPVVLILDCETDQALEDRIERLFYEFSNVVTRHRTVPINLLLQVAGTPLRVTVDRKYYHEVPRANRGIITAWLVQPQFKAQTIGLNPIILAPQEITERILPKIQTS